MTKPGSGTWWRAASVFFALACSAAAALSEPTPGGTTGGDNTTVATEQSDQQQVEELVATLVLHLTNEGGIVAFDKLTYPLIIVLGGPDPAIVPIESSQDLAVAGGGEAVLANLELRVLGRVALADFTFGWKERPGETASAFAVMSKPLDFWVVHALSVAPAAPADEPTDNSHARPDKDALAAVAQAFCDAMTTTGPVECDVVKAPFFVYDGGSGNRLSFLSPKDFPVPGDPLGIKPVRVRSTILNGLARISVTAVKDDNVGDCELLCVKTPTGWQVVHALVSPGEPTTGDNPETAGS